MEHLTNAIKRVESGTPRQSRARLSRSHLDCEWIAEYQTALCPAASYYV